MPKVLSPEETSQYYRDLVGLKVVAIMNTKTETIIYLAQDGRNFGKRISFSGGLEELSEFEYEEISNVE